MKQICLCGAAAALITLFAFGFVAGSARAEGDTIHIRARFSGTFGTAQVDTNGDGLLASTQDFGTIGGELGPSNIKGIDEFIPAGQGTCANGNPGPLYTLLITPTSPVADVQRFERSGDLLYLLETSVSVCFDATTGQAFADAAGNIVGGTGQLAGASGTFVQHTVGTSLFFDGTNGFGPQTGTFEEKIILP